MNKQSIEAAPSGLYCAWAIPRTGTGNGWEEALGEGFGGVGG